MAVLATRQYGNNICYDRYNRQVACNSGWYTWGRWVSLGVILVVAFLVFFLCSCLTARRRRKAGRQPYYGTGWAGGNHGTPQYNPNGAYQSRQTETQPPSYNQNQGGYYGQNQGYFGGGQQTETEMQPPQNAYAPPAGPPPNKR